MGSFHMAIISNAACYIGRYEPTVYAIALDRTRKPNSALWRRWCLPAISSSVAYYWYDTGIWCHTSQVKTPQQMQTKNHDERGYQYPMLDGFQSKRLDGKGINSRVTGRPRTQSMILFEQGMVLSGGFDGGHGRHLCIFSTDAGLTNQSCCKLDLESLIRSIRSTRARSLISLESPQLSKLGRSATPILLLAEGKPAVVARTFAGCYLLGVG